MLQLIDCHRHFGGCLDPELVLELLDGNFSYTLHNIANSLKFSEGEILGFQEFLKKFKILESIEWTEDKIDLAINHVSAQIKREVDVAWVDFSLDKFVSCGMSPKRIITLFSERFEKYSGDSVRLILSMKYESKTCNHDVLKKVLSDPDVIEKIIGIDLVGDESKFIYGHYMDIFKEWSNYNKMLRVHAGESQSCINVRNAIVKLNATNIAHGIKIVNSPEIISIARDNDITFDMAITSNVLTKSCTIEDHPIKKLYYDGIKITLGSDDPVQCDTTLINEFEILRKMCVNNEEFTNISNNMMINANLNNKKFT